MLTVATANASAKKGGDMHLVPVRHDLQLPMGRDLQAAGLAGEPDKSSLFRTARKN
jgi:hypothetical protein